MTAQFRLWDIAPGEQIAGQQFTTTPPTRDASRI